MNVTSAAVLYILIGNPLVTSLLQGSIIPIAMIRLNDGRAVAVWSDAPATPYDSVEDLMADIIPPRVAPMIASMAIAACTFVEMEAFPIGRFLAEVRTRYVPSPDDRQLEMWPEPTP
jgi:hypothetical protein